MRSCAIQAMRSLTRAPKELNPASLHRQSDIRNRTPSNLKCNTEAKIHRNIFWQEDGTLLANRVLCWSDCTSPWYIDPIPMVFWPPYPWYIDTPTHGISTPTHGILTPYPWYKYPLTHGILTPYQWYMEPLPMAYRHSYPWYIDPYPWYFDPLSMA